MRKTFFIILAIISISSLTSGCNKKSTQVKKEIAAEQSIVTRNDTDREGNQYSQPVINICKKVESIDIPKETSSPELKGCNPWDYFYGINDHTVDYDKARRCALIQEDDADNILNSYQILEMIYANGYGTKKNINLAIALACDNGEPDEAILTLNSGNINPENPFNLCDYAKDPNTITICNNFLPMAINQNKRNMELKQITQKWPQADQKAFEHLKQTSDDYIDAYTNGEIDLSTYEDRRQYDKNDELNGVFMNYFSEMEKGQFPNYSAQDFVKLDKKLNQNYRTIMERNDDSYNVGVSHESIKKVQRAWLKYRDAWVAVAKIHYPRATPSSIKAWLTAERINDLKNDFEIEKDS